MSEPKPKQSRSKQPLTPEQFLIETVVTKTLRRQDFIVFSLMGVFMVAILATIVLFYLQALGIADLDKSLLHWMGAATIGEIVGLSAIGIKSTFKNPLT